MRANIPLVIKNTLSTCDGTIISGESTKERIITGITYMGDRIQIRIKENDNLNNANYSLLLDEIALNHISIDLINVFPEENMFTIDKWDFEIFSKMMEKLNLLFTHIDNCSKIAIIGSGMRGIPGIMARIFKAITKEDIRILQSADSHTTIWVLVKDNSVKVAINSLHKEFELG
jgi:aspartate kinase